MTITSWPARSKSSARTAPTRPQPTMTIFTLVSSGIGSRTTQTAHGAFFRTYGIGPADREVAAEPRAVGQADDEQVGVALDRLVDQRRADVAGLEQDRLELDLDLLRPSPRRGRAPAGPPPSGRRRRRRAAATSRPRRRGRRSARAFVAPSPVGVARRTIRSSLEPPFSARTARLNGGGHGLGHGRNDTTGRGPRPSVGGPAVRRLGRGRRDPPRLRRTRRRPRAGTGR